MNKSLKPFESYLATLNSDQIKLLLTLHRRLTRRWNKLETKMAYGIPTYFYNGVNIIHFGIYRQHLGVYPGKAAIDHFKPRFTGYAVSTGTLRIPLSKKIPYALIMDIVAFRLKEEEKL